MNDGKPRWFIAKIKAVDDLDEDAAVVFSEEEWSSDGRNGEEDETLGIYDLEEVVLCSKTRQKEVILGAML